MYSWIDRDYTPIVCSISSCDSVPFKSFLSGSLASLTILVHTLYGLLISVGRYPYFARVGASIWGFKWAWVYSQSLFSNKISLVRIASPIYTDQIVWNLSWETLRISIRLSRPVLIIFHDIFIFVSSRTDVWSFRIRSRGFEFSTTSFWNVQPGKDFATGFTLYH